MKTLVRTFSLAAALALTALATGYAADPSGSCRIACSDGSSYQVCGVTYPRCRTDFNNLCGGTGQYAWQEGGC
jgi:hypothetical protein